MDPSKSTEDGLDKAPSIPRSRQGSEEALVGEVIGKGVPLGRPVVDAEPKDPPRRRGRLRTIIIVVLCVSALTCLGGGIAGLVWYRNASEPDRGTPATTLNQYLDAKFSLRDDVIAKRFECSSPSLGAVDNARASLVDRENRLGVKVEVRVTNLETSTKGTSASVNADLVLSTSYNGALQRAIEKWRFTLVNQEGWRVCDALKLS